MSRVATNHSTTARLNNGLSPSATTSILNRSSSNASSIHSISNGSTGNARNVTVRSAAPPPAQKERVNVCPLCDSGYKDPRVLPCTHTYCLNCIRDKLIKNNHVTCPKCHHQVHPFDESQLRDLPQNQILSQGWRVGARPILPSPASKKPITFHQSTPAINSSSIPTSQMPHHEQQQQDKRKSSTAETGVHETTNGTGASIAERASLFNKAAGNGARSSRASSVTSNAASHASGGGGQQQSVVSNLTKIYSEATGQKTQHQPEKQRVDSVAATGKYDELTRIFEQASNQSQRHRTPSSSIVKQPTQAHEEAYEEITWDNLVHGEPPVAPPFPGEWHAATENRHHPPQAPERPISAASSIGHHHSRHDDDHTNISNLRDMMASVHQQFRDQSSSHAASPRQGPVLDSQISSRDSIANSSQDDIEEDNDDLGGGNRTPVRQLSYTVNSQQRHVSNADNVHSPNNVPPRRSPIPPVSNYQPRSSVTTTQQQQQPKQDDRLSIRTGSATSSSRHSVDRFPPPPPPQQMESLNFGSDRDNKGRPASSVSTRSSVYVDARERPSSHESNLLPTERFNPDIDMPPPVHTANSSRAPSHIGSGASTPTVRPPSDSVERDSRQYRQQQQQQQQQHYLAPTTSSSTVSASVSSRVNTLLSDQKRLEREIEEAIKRLTYDYEDVQSQIDRKESSIHAEVKNIAARLDEDITEHYHRKQKIYALLAADTSTVGSELERLRSTTGINNNNKQQLWTSLEQLESNIHKIRQAVEQEKEPRGTLTFAEGRRAIAADTIGQITFTGTEHRHPSPQPPLSVRNLEQQPITALTPYKYLKIDHLATLEPEAIAITEHSKKILLGICNKLFILNEYGDTLKTISLAPSIRGIAVSKKPQSLNIAYISHDETVSMIDIDSGQSLDCVKETDAHGESGTFLPLGIDTDNVRGDVYVCDYRNSCVIKFDEKLEFITQWRIYNHSNQYDEARPKLISVYGQRLYMIVEHSCKPYYNQGIAYTFSLHICDSNTGNIVKIIDAELLSTQRLRWPCSVQAINNEKCYILDTMTSGKYFNGQWQKHWSRVLEIAQGDAGVVTELFQLDSEAATMAMTKQTMVIAANGEILYVDLAFLQKHQRNGVEDEHNYQNIA